MTNRRDDDDDDNDNNNNNNNNNNNEPMYKRKLTAHTNLRHAKEIYFQSI